MSDFQDYRKAVSPDLLALVRAGCEHVVRARPHNQIIQRNGSPYIRRWMLARKAHVPVYDDPSWPVLGGELGFVPSEIENLYLHSYDRSDRDDPHCHPWPSVTLLVRGAYTENRYEAGTNRLIETAFVTPGDVVVRTAESVHAIIETSPDCLSLFGTLQKAKDWGFYTPEGFVHSTQYHANSASFGGMN